MIRNKEDYVTIRHPDFNMGWRPTDFSMRQAYPSKNRIYPQNFFTTGNAKGSFGLERNYIQWKPRATEIESPENTILSKTLCESQTTAFPHESAPFVDCGVGERTRIY